MIDFLIITMHLTGMMLFALFLFAIFSGMINLIFDPTVLICTFLCSALLVACMA